MPVTVRVTFREKVVATEAGRSGEYQSLLFLDPSLTAPRGWQLNPVISREAAAMCEVDYKSALRRPRKKNDAAVIWDSASVLVGAGRP